MYQGHSNSMLLAAYRCCVKPHKETWCKPFYLSSDARTQPAVSLCSAQAEGQLSSVPFSEQSGDSTIPSLLPSGSLWLLCVTHGMHKEVVESTGTSVGCEMLMKDTLLSILILIICAYHTILFVWRFSQNKKLVCVYSRRNLAISNQGSFSPQSIALCENVWIKDLTGGWNLHVVSRGQNLRVMLLFSPMPL